MHASRIVALTAVSLSLFTASAWADGTAKPAAKDKVTVLPGIDVVCRSGCGRGVSVDVAPVPETVPLRPLQKPAADVAAAVERDPF